MVESCSVEVERFFINSTVFERLDVSLRAQWILLNTIDFFLTWIAFRYGAIEGNPVMQLFSVNSVGELAVWKVAFVFGVLLLLEVIQKPGVLRPAIVMRLTNRGMLIVCIWNVLVIQAVAVGLV